MKTNSKLHSLQKAVVLVMWGAIIGWAVYSLLSHPREFQSISANASRRAPLSDVGSTAFSKLLDRPATSVVGVLSQRSRLNWRGPETNEPRRPTPGILPKHREETVGSGVIVDSAGYVLTNEHLVKQQNDIEVLLWDGRTLRAQFIAADPLTDLALLKVDAGQLPALPFSVDTKPKLGDLVFAVGRPFGMGRTVTMGIVSARSEADSPLAGSEGLLLTDAIINNSNSGGALIDTTGHLVGINNAKTGHDCRADSFGVAIPSELASSFINHLLERKDGSQPPIGMSKRAPRFAPDQGEREK